jgi:hypothetical protein
MTNVFTIIQKIITAPLVSFALMTPMPETLQSENIGYYPNESSLGQSSSVWLSMYTKNSNE